MYVLLNDGFAAVAVSPELPELHRTDFVYLLI